MNSHALSPDTALTIGASGRPISPPSPMPKAMSEIFVDQLHQAIDTLCWVDARSEHSYIEHILANLAWLSDVCEATDY